MADATKHCRRCQSDKPCSEFARNARRSTGLADWCRSCNREDYWRRERGKAAPPIKRPRARRSRQADLTRAYLRREYGITACEVTKLRLKQGDRCAICRTSEAPRLVIDHCHATGRLRGLLCDNCNRALGLLKDDRSRLESALVYLAG